MPEWVIAIIKILIVLAFIGLNGIFLIWAERKVAGFIQARIGPARVGKPQGFFQLFADAIKMFSKEDVRPAAADKWVWWFAPVVFFTPVAMAFLVLPFGPNVIGLDMNIGLIYLAAVASFALLGVFMAGWGSNNKYSLLGAMRAGAQMISYEIPLILATIGVIMITGTLSTQGIVEYQVAHGWNIKTQFLAFVVFFIAMLAELNRTPFDLVIAESELTSGFFTEYSGIRWGMFMFAEYTNIFVMSALAVTLFFGGWASPFGLVGSVLIFLIKTYAIVFLIIWIRWSVPRVRIDQLMTLGWKFLLPLSLFNIVFTGLILLI